MNHHIKIYNQQRNASKNKAWKSENRNKIERPPIYLYSKRIEQILLLDLAWGRAGPTCTLQARIRCHRRSVSASDDASGPLEGRGLAEPVARDSWKVLGEKNQRPRFGKPWPWPSADQDRGRVPRDLPPPSRSADAPLWDTCSFCTPSWNQNRKLWVSVIQGNDNEGSLAFLCSVKALAVTKLWL